ncbi:hypothetical protein [Anaerotalea alkaliphila]|uniref:Uncharacterized protein n=1 Tax=Anaerotalea alkaliphila TaxID=2662126 RepID=A0A7X5KN47_9FIRM|nr:hypothetical protein [Anaerotalea alkaliphila]NDL68494.1 hypothetical protein [Anaerotalea alkaliphila]
MEKQKMSKEEFMARMAKSQKPEEAPKEVRGYKYDWAGLARHLIGSAGGIDFEKAMEIAGVPKDKQRGQRTKSKEMTDACLKDHGYILDIQDGQWAAVNLIPPEPDAYGSLAPALDQEDEEEALAYEEQISASKANIFMDMNIRVDGEFQLLQLMQFIRNTLVFCPEGAGVRLVLTSGKEVADA